MKAKIAFALFTTLTIFVTRAQDGNIDANNSANVDQLTRLSGGQFANAGLTGQASFFNPKFDREGSIYLFDGWDQAAFIYPKGTDQFVRENSMNFNIQRSMFETKVAGDSIVSYNFVSIDRIVVGGRVFKSFFLEELQRDKAFEIVYQGSDFTILKGYTVDVLEASPNPMIARPRDKYIQRTTYYLETEETLKEFKLKKKSILAALTDEQAERAKEYSKKYDMSFTNEAELKKILNYASRK